METDPSIESVAEPTTDPFPWRFKPGNPFAATARVTQAMRVKAEAQRLVTEFVSTYSRKPSHAESVQIGTCALLAVKLERGRGRHRRALTPEDISRMSSVLARMLKRVGLSTTPTRAATGPRRRAAVEIIGGS